MSLLSLVPWWGRLLAIVALVVACMGFGAVKMHQHDSIAYDTLESRYNKFVSDTAVAGAVAKIASAAKEKSDKENKEKADVENKRTHAADAAELKRLRNQRAGSGFVPAASSTSNRPDIACFDRVELERAIRDFDAGLQGLVDEGSAATVDLNTVKRWAAP